MVACACDPSTGGDRNRQIDPRGSLVRKPGLIYPFQVPVRDPAFENQGGCLLENGTWRWPLACTPMQHIHTCTYMNKYTPAHAHKNEFVLFKLVRIKRNDFFLLLLGIRDKLTGSLNCGYSHCNLLIVFSVDHIVFTESWFWLFPNLQAFMVMLTQCPLLGE